jgi:hypothetical protein
VEKFVFEYIAADLRAELGGKTISKSTLYNWMGKYQSHDEAGLVPQYKERGGYGASLDKHVKELIWFYYLHKNKPPVAQVLRKLAEKEGIEVNPAKAYRYIRYEIPSMVKAYFRKGKKYYHDHYESYITIDYTRYHAMQMAVYDHKTLDFASRVKRADGWQIELVFKLHRTQRVRNRCLGIIRYRQKSMYRRKPDFTASSYWRRFVKPGLIKPVFPPEQTVPPIRWNRKRKYALESVEGTAGYAHHSSLRAVNFVPPHVFSSYVPTASFCLRRFQTTKSSGPVPSTTSYL